VLRLRAPVSPAMGRPALLLAVVCRARRGEPGRPAGAPHGRAAADEQLLAEIEASSFLEVGRRYGVSDNAIRKWLRAYEAEERRDAERV
jgi:hypothetical protein